MKSRCIAKTAAVNSGVTARRAMAPLEAAHTGITLRAAATAQLGNGTLTPAVHAAQPGSLVFRYDPTDSSGR